MEQSIDLIDNHSSEYAVKCTIGICVYNEERNIAHLLDNLLTEQRLHKNAEIIVVSSGSTDSTNKLVAEVCKRDSRVELVVQAIRLGKWAAINEIFKRASNEIVFLIPGDVLPAPLAIVSMEREFSNSSVGVVCGHPIPVNSRRDFSSYLASLIWRMHNRTLKMLSESHLNTHATGELMAVRKRLVVLLTKETVNDDAYIAMHVVRKGFTVLYCESARVYMKAPTNLFDYLRQRRRIIFGHHSVKASTGHYPHTLESMAFYDPKKVIRVVREEIFARPSNIPKFAMAIFVEVIAIALAMLDIMSRKQHAKWSVAMTTKDLIDCWLEPLTPGHHG